MEEDFARLSFKVGLFCGRADAFLGKMYFTSRARKVAWELTPERLEQWQEEARSMGVPDDVVAETPEDRTAEASLIKAGLEAQRRVDRRSVH